MLFFVGAPTSTLNSVEESAPAQIACFACASPRACAYACACVSARSCAFACACAGMYAGMEARAGWGAVSESYICAKGRQKKQEYNKSINKQLNQWKQEHKMKNRNGWQSHLQ